MSFQQLMRASAAVRLSIANRRAVSARSSRRLGSSASLRATPFQIGAGWLFTNTAMWVCSGVRFVLSRAPSLLDLVELLRVGGAGEVVRAVRANLGRALEQEEEARRRSRGWDRRADFHPAASSGRQSPGSVPHTQGRTWRRSCPWASMASAAAIPAAIPFSLAGPAGTSASDSS